MTKILKFVILFAAILTVASIFVYKMFSPAVVVKKYNKDNAELNLELKLDTTTPDLTPSSEPINSIEPKPKPRPKSPIILPPKTPTVEPIREVSSKSFEELVNGAVIQLYCGYLGGEGTNYSGISRGSGIIITSQGEILTNRHIIYDENMKKAKPDCFVLKSPFPNSKSERPKIYYTAQVINYPSQEKISEIFSIDKYYNDFAILKIASRPTSEMKINQLLQTDYASEADYSVLEGDGVFNYFPIDWNYRPKNDDFLITLGYGVDAGHIANQITSTVGRLTANIDIAGTSAPQILLIESNATAGFSGGALINPQSKGLIGLISWITSGEVTGKYTVAIFRDFLRNLMLQELNFDLRLATGI